MLDKKVDPHRHPARILFPVSFRGNGATYKYLCSPNLHSRGVALCQDVLAILSLVMKALKDQDARPGSSDSQRVWKMILHSLASGITLKLPQKGYIKETSNFMTSYVFLNSFRVFWWCLIGYIGKDVLAPDLSLDCLVAAFGPLAAVHFYVFQLTNQYWQTRLQSNTSNLKLWPPGWKDAAFSLHRPTTPHICETSPVAGRVLYLAILRSLVQGNPNGFKAVQQANRKLNNQETLCILGTSLNMAEHILKEVPLMMSDVPSFTLFFCSSAFSFSFSFLLFFIHSFLSHPRLIFRHSWILLTFSFSS